MSSSRSNSKGGSLAWVGFVCLLMLFGADRAMSEETATYVNAEFRFELVYPSDWQVASPSDVKRREESGLEGLDLPERLPTMERELFSVASYIENRQRGRLSVKYYPLPPDEYLATSLEFMDKGIKSAELKILEGPFEVSFHGHVYHIVKVELDFGSGSARGEMFFTSVDGGSLMFILTASQGRVIEELFDIFSTVKFK
jgi:hypothetical protein